MKRVAVGVFAFFAFGVIWFSAQNLMTDDPDPLAGGPGTGRPSADADIGTKECSPAYDVCIPPAPPDLDCGDVDYSDFIVRAPDPHGFDANQDGYGCEPYP